MFPQLDKYSREECISAMAELDSSRKAALDKIREYIEIQSSKGKVAKLVFICTHNSRRSQFAQVWAAVAAHYFRQENAISFSGGTEVTACHPNTIAALERAGFRIEKEIGENPKYHIHYSDHSDPLICHSKLYNSPENPAEQFCAVMTCSEADTNCPLVEGAELRIALPFEDPKVSDGKSDQDLIYDERCTEIAGAMFYLFMKKNN